LGILRSKLSGRKKIAAVSAGNEPGTKAELARRLGIARSTLYYRKKLPAKDEKLRRRIEAVMRANPGYGYRRVGDALGINRKRAKRVMRKFGLKPARRAKAPRKPLDMGREPARYPDILAKLCPAVPDFVWASDFTFLSYRGEFIFLVTVLDVFTGEPLGFNVSRCHDAMFVRLAVERALCRHRTVPTWFHSDQGSEYVAEEVCVWLQSLGVRISMTPKASPWRNGSQESFFGRYKIEFGDPDRFDTLAELLEELYRMLHYFGHRRIKNRLRMPPVEFRKRWLTRHPLYRSKTLPSAKNGLHEKKTSPAFALQSTISDKAKAGYPQFTPLPGYPQLISLPPSPPPSGWHYHSPR
jgi:transposase InsO family protein